MDVEALGNEGWERLRKIGAGRNVPRITGMCADGCGGGAGRPPALVLAFIPPYWLDSKLLLRTGHPRALPSCLGAGARRRRRLNPFGCAHGSLRSVGRGKFGTDYSETARWSSTAPNDFSIRQPPAKFSLPPRTPPWRDGLLTGICEKVGWGLFWTDKISQVGRE